MFLFLASVFLLLLESTHELLEFGRWGEKVGEKF